MSNVRRRPSVQPLIKRYLDAGFDMGDIVTEITPEGGFKVYVKMDRQVEKVSPSKEVMLTEWNTAPSFE